MENPVFSSTFNLIKSAYEEMAKQANDSTRVFENETSFHKRDLLLHPNSPTAENQDIQTVLVKSCWSELFTLGLAQCSQTMSLPTILMAILNHLQTALHQDKTSAERIKIVIDHILKLQNYIQSMHQLNVDTEEYAYLKALVLFSPGKYILKHGSILSL
ncbi:NR2C2 [Mytilus edulis]|uniref:NR2C2 n=1 Tax=Mytilus edulis TaxID=6550 RepID=A0A8S3QWG1_MYTED|nr:NR2C2 [Mytilus edulis]